MDFLEMLARRTAPPGTQFDLFDNTLPRRAAPAPIAGPTIQQVIAADPTQGRLPLRGRNPLVNMALPEQQARAAVRAAQALPQLEMFPGQPPVRTAAPTAAVPAAPQLIDPAQRAIPLKGSNAQAFDTRIPAQQARAAQRTMPQLNLFENPQERAIPQPRSGPAQLEMFADEVVPAARAVPPTAPTAGVASTVAKAAPVDEIAEIAKTLAGKTSRFPRLANMLSGAGAGPIMPISLQDISTVAAGGKLPEQEAAMENLRVAGAGVAEAWQQKGLDPTVKALFQGAKRIAFGAPGAAAAPVVSAVPDTSPMREGTLQELLATPAPVAAAGATPQAAAAQAAPTNLLSQMEQVARAYPNMNLRQLIALTNALPATNGAGAAALAPSRGKDLIFEAAVSDYYQNLKELAAANLPPKEARIERSRLLSELIAAQNPQYGLLNPPEEE